MTRIRWCRCPPGVGFFVFKAAKPEGPRLSSGSKHQLDCGIDGFGIDCAHRWEPGSLLTRIMRIGTKKGLSAWYFAGQATNRIDYGFGPGPTSRSDVCCIDDRLHSRMAGSRVPDPH